MATRYPRAAKSQLRPRLQLLARRPIIQHVRVEVDLTKLTLESLYCIACVIYVNTGLVLTCTSTNIAWENEPKIYSVGGVPNKHHPDHFVVFSNPTFIPRYHPLPGQVPEMKDDEMNKNFEKARVLLSKALNNPPQAENIEAENIEAENIEAENIETENNEADQIKQQIQHQIKHAFEMVGTKLIKGYTYGTVEIDFKLTYNLFDGVKTQIYPFIKFMLTNDLVLMQRTFKEDAGKLECLVNLNPLNSAWSYRNHLTIHKETYKQCTSVNPFVFYTQFKNKISTDGYDVVFHNMMFDFTTVEIHSAIELVFESYTNLEARANRTNGLLYLKGFCTSIVLKILMRISLGFSAEQTLTDKSITDILKKSFLNGLQDQRIYQPEDGLIIICAMLIAKCFLNMFKPKLIESTDHNEILSRLKSQLTEKVPGDAMINQTVQFLSRFNQRCDTHDELLRKHNPVHTSVFYHDIICMFEHIESSYLNIYMTNNAVEEVLTRNAIIEHLLKSPEKDDESQIAKRRRITNHRRNYIYTFFKQNEETGIFKSSIYEQVIDDFYMMDENWPEKKIMIETTTIFLENTNLESEDKLKEVLEQIDEIVKKKDDKKDSDSGIFLFLPLMQAFFKRKNELNIVLGQLSQNPTTEEEQEKQETALFKWEPHILENHYKQFRKKFVREGNGFVKFFKNTYKKIGTMFLKDETLRNEVTKINSLILLANEGLPENKQHKTLILPIKDKLTYLSENFEKIKNGINYDIMERIELIAKARWLDKEPLSVDHLDSDVITFYSNFLKKEGNARGGSPPSPYLLNILGRSRKIVKKGRCQYVTYKKELIKLSEARKIEQQLARDKNKSLKLYKSKNSKVSEKYLKI
jgi:hypothetical protein